VPLGGQNIWNSMTLTIHTAWESAVYTIQTLTATQDKVLPNVQHKNHTSEVQENYVFFFFFN